MMGVVIDLRHAFSQSCFFATCFIRDTVGTLIALHALGVTAVSASKLPIGEGMVWTDHGCLPVPAPATLRLLIDMPVCKVSTIGMHAPFLLWSRALIHLPIPFHSGAAWNYW